MKKVLFAFLVVCMMTSHADFPFTAQKNFSVKNDKCNHAFDNIYYEELYNSQCREPMDVLIPLKPTASYENIFPRAVWVERCVGLCDLNSLGSKCTPGKKIIEQIPVNLTNDETGEKVCSLYSVERHLSCVCCNRAEKHCVLPRVFKPRTCTCACPNNKARRDCMKDQGMKWNRNKCQCEKKSPSIA